MRELTWPLGVMIVAIVLSVGFILIAPTGILARAINTVGGFIQRIIAWIVKLFS